MMKKYIAITGIGMYTLGIVVLIVLVVPPLELLLGFDATSHLEVSTIAGGFVFFGLLSAHGGRITKIGIGKFTIETDLPIQETVIVKRKLEPEVEQQRRDHANTLATVPGQYAPPFQVLEDSTSLRVIPSSDPMVPMYRLDDDFRIIEWNEAFSLCFDRTMEGRRGMSVLEWVYFLENYEESLNHGIEAFSDQDNLPRIDLETIRYNSIRYGSIQGEKRAFQIPADDGSCLGWLVTIDIEFLDENMASKFQSDLFNRLSNSLIWSEYALSYDRVLNKTDIYPELIQTLAGQNGELPSLRPGSNILDLGAGTGNLTQRLAQDESHLVVALDNNPMMLATLRQKCQPYLRNDSQGNGVLAIKQDISSLFGFGDGFFDYVFINNVLYSMDDDAVESCLKESYRVLKDGGEIRISDPQKKTKIDKLLSQIKKNLDKNGQYDNVKQHYLNIERINQFHLKSMIFKWTVDDMEARLHEAGYQEIFYKSDKAYGGQSLMICATK